ncbi:MAG: 3-methylornithine--L-lysine ligase PylC [Dehalobacterium sp.]
MRVAIVGGKLQGVEAAYLAQKAGWEVYLIDKSEHVPAQGLCDYFYCLDVSQKNSKIKNIFSRADLILPVLENKEALESLFYLAQTLNKPLAFDSKAYEISSSKVESNRVFLKTGIPIPKLWPECGLPLVVKPSGSSGSEGVLKIRNEQELKEIKENPDLYKDWVIQEFVEGPSYSIEVIGHQGRYQTYQVTELEMDEKYDCKRVLAPAVLSSQLVQEFERIGKTIAGHLQLSSIMDVEVILHDGLLKVLEIDARLPSQTPTVVYKSSGVNMVEILGENFMYGKTILSKGPQDNRGVIYEHITVSPDAVKVCGEHIMSEAGPLSLIPEFFGADEAITNFAPGKKEWVATLIISGKTRQEAWEKRCGIIDWIMKEMQINQYIDLLPQS